MSESDAPFYYESKQFNEETGEWEYYDFVQVGGKDENGFFVVIKEGPAQGERVYV